MKKRIRTAAIFPGLFLVFICIIMMKEQSIVRKSVAEALSLCTYTVIPSLFPFTVLSLLLTASNVFSSPLFRPLRPLTNALRLPQNSIGAILCGFFCGFPLGAASVSELYKAGELSRSQANRLLAIANNTGPAFIICLTGSVLFRDVSFGIFLYALQIFSALLLGIFFAGISKEESALPVNLPNCMKKTHTRFAGAVTRAAGSMLSVCAMIVLFRVFADILAEGLPLQNIPSAKAFVAAVLECISGTTGAASVGGIPGGAIAGFSIGWSGISVLLQCQLFLEGTDLSMKPCIVTKLLQGIILSVGSTFFFLFRKKELLPTGSSIEINYRILTAVEITLLGLVVFSGAIICGLLERRENKKSS